MKYGGGLTLAWVSFVFMACATTPSFTPEDKAAETARLNAFLEKSFDEFLQLRPESLSEFGKKDRYSELNDHSESFDVKMQELRKTKLIELKKFRREALEPQAQISWDLAVQQTQNQIEDFRWKDHMYAITQQHGVHSNLPTFMINVHKVDSEQDLKDYLARLKEFRRVFAEVRDQMERSRKLGVVPPRFVFEPVRISAQKVIQGRPFESSSKDSPLYADFKKKLGKLKLKKADAEAYRSQAEEILKSYVRPAYEGLVAALTEIEKTATTDDGAWKLPQGAEYYRVRLQRSTTTDLDAETIHALGLKNVERLRQDMMAVQKRMGIKGDLQSFFKVIRKDRRQYFPDSDAGRKAYIKLAESYKTQIDKKTGDYFKVQPKTPMEIRAVEKFREQSAGKAFYDGPSDDGTRPGVYYVNLRSMRDVPKFEAEALFYHEGIPGHHFQIARSIELPNLPRSRKYARFTAYTEGWGLYAERLGKEMGGYEKAGAELGRLSLEMMRACRLVVDTGIHHKRWTRAQALEFLNQNLPVAEGMITEQVERYIVWPGQATAYMVGMLKIVELREKAQAQLGSRFDVRDFHEVVLQNGPLPLQVLEQNVMAYIQQNQKKEVL